MNPERATPPSTCAALEAQMVPAITRARALRQAGAAAAAILALGSIPRGALAHAGPAFAARGSTIDAAIDHLRADMRRLWEDHIVWTRLAIVSVAAGLPDLEPTVGRLLQNQTHIGDALKPIYGAAAGDALTALLEDHITVAAQLLTAAKAGNAAEAARAKDAWYANGDDIAAFLAAANPAHWPLDAAKVMMRGHLDHTLEEALARFKGDWAADIAAYDKVHEHILMMADVLTMGIVNQFPERFVSVAAEQVAVPELRGLGEGEAVRRIEGAGLTPTLSNRQTIGEVPAEARDYFRGVAGTSVWRGTPVLLAVRDA